jgi:hypothetical protein
MCVGFFDHLACEAVCPVDCCVPNPCNMKTEEEMLALAKQLHADKNLPDLADLPARLSIFRKL